MLVHPGQTLISWLQKLPKASTGKKNGKRGLPAGNLMMVMLLFDGDLAVFFV